MRAKEGAGARVLPASGGEGKSRRPLEEGFCKGVMGGPPTVRGEGRTRGRSFRAAERENRLSGWVPFPNFKKFPAWPTI